MIQNVWNDQVFKLFIDAYKKSYSYETLWGSSRDHVEFGRIKIEFLKNVSDLMKLGEDLKTWTGSARSCDWLYDTKRMKWPIYRRLQKILQLWNSMG